MILEKYSNAHGAAGNEIEIRKIIYDDIKDRTSDIKVDPLGNLQGIQKKSGKGSVLLTAHMDEVALIVEKVESNGLIVFQALGGFIDRILPGTAVAIGKDKIPGIIGMKSYHIMNASERSTNPTIKNMFIDIGASNDKEAGSVIPGDTIYFISKFYEQNNRYFGKAFDDRCGCSAITEALLDNQSQLDLAFSYNVQEEVGLRGGAVSAWSWEHLKFSLNLEGTTCSDRDLKHNHSPSTEHGKGPAITIMDRTSIVNRKLADFVINLAKKYSIPYQFKQTVTGGTDSGYIHLTKEGIPSIGLSVPVRYIHAPWGIISKDDYENYLKLAKIIINHAHEFEE